MRINGRTPKQAGERRFSPRTVAAAMALLALGGCYRDVREERPSALEGVVSKHPGRHPIDRYNRMGYWSFDVDGGGQVLVYSPVFINCPGRSRVEGGWVKVTDNAAHESGPPLTELEFVAHSWKCL